ncbi:venom toxin OcyC11-like [Haematobia irritans]|uniref:venom toxin OcyC11-like n=1 Tax=Haematobia irritans TaxID=7368 RepID=UPI003F4FFB06
MRFVICILFLISLIHLGYGALSTGFFTDKDHPGKCVHMGLILSPGESAKPQGHCMNFQCLQADGLGEIQTCGVEAPMPNCKHGDYINVDAPYTECCKRHQICD